MMPFYMQPLTQKAFKTPLPEGEVTGKVGEEFDLTQFDLPEVLEPVDEESGQKLYLHKGGEYPLKGKFTDPGRNPYPVIYDPTPEG